MTTGVTVSVPKIPSIVVFGRHADDCAYKDDPDYKKCRCPKHFSWSYGGRQYRRSAKTRSWEQAVQNRRKLEDKL